MKHAKKPYNKRPGKWAYIIAKAVINDKTDVDYGKDRIGPLLIWNDDVNHWRILDYILNNPGCCDNDIRLEFRNTDKNYREFVIWYLLREEQIRKANEIREGRKTPKPRYYALEDI